MTKTKTPTPKTADTIIEAAAAKLRVVDVTPAREDTGLGSVVRAPISSKAGSGGKVGSVGSGYTVRDGERLDDEHSRIELLIGKGEIRDMQVLVAGVGVILITPMRFVPRAMLMHRDDPDIYEYGDEAALDDCEWPQAEVFSLHCQTRSRDWSWLGDVSSMTDLDILLDDGTLARWFEAARAGSSEGYSATDDGPTYTHKPELGDIQHLPAWVRED